MKLYEITQGIRNLSEIEDKEQFNAELERLNFIFKDKALHIGKFVKELQSDVEAIDNEIKRLSQRKTSLSNKVDWLRDYLLLNMTQNKMERIEDSIISILIRKNPPSISAIRDVASLPEQFRKANPELWIPLRNEILKHFKETGEIPENVDIEVNKTHVEIK